MSDGVHRYLVTAGASQKMDMWGATCAVANWVEGRPNGDRETWIVTVYAEHGAGFLEAARTIGVTVQELHGAGEDERYELLVGETGTGWPPAGRTRRGKR